MKFKHFLVLTVVFALAALVTSCNKPSENQILGKWRTVSIQRCTSVNPDTWEDVSLPADEVNVMEFLANGTCVYYDEDGLEERGTWSYDKDNQKITINGVVFDIVSFSSKEMVLDYKFSYGESWIETKTTLKKVA